MVVLLPECQMSRVIHSSGKEVKNMHSINVCTENRFYEVNEIIVHHIRSKIIIIMKNHVFYAKIIILMFGMALILCSEWQYSLHKASHLYFEYYFHKCITLTEEEN